MKEKHFTLTIGGKVRHFVAQYTATVTEHDRKPSTVEIDDLTATEETEQATMGVDADTMKEILSYLEEMETPEDNSGHYMGEGQKYLKIN